jgi:hypothetical protein
LTAIDPDFEVMSISQPPVRRTYTRRKHLRGLRSEMHTRDCFIEPERAAPALTEAATRFSDRSDPAPRENSGRGRRILRPRARQLIIAVANITSGPASTPPPAQVGRD